MGILEDIEEYRRRILWAHYDAFKCIKHQPTKGSMREKAVSRLIAEEFPRLSLVSGITCVEDSDWQSPQLDLIELRANAHQGIDRIYRISDVKSVCEVKTNARASDFRTSEQTAKLVKDHSESYIATRMFSFATDASAEHVISQFGFQKNRDIQGFENYKQELDRYPSIDCFISMDAAAKSPSPFLIVRDIGTSRMLFRSNAKIVDRFLALYRPD